GARYLRGNSASGPGERSTKSENPEMHTYLLKSGVPLLAAMSLISGSLARAQDRKGDVPDGVQVVNVFSPVEVRTTVIACKPEGAAVKKGEVVCELDPEPVRDRLAHQALMLQRAKAAYLNARLAREVAEIKVREYEDGTYKQDLQTVNGEIALAEAHLNRIEE